MQRSDGRYPGPMAQRKASGTYHHGNLREALVDAAVDRIREEDVGAISLRDLARRVGVTHGAAAHHFGDKRGLLTAIAARGFGQLAEALEAAMGGGFRAVGLAYVRFAVEHPAEFSVMFRPELHRSDDALLLAAKARSGAALYGSAGEVADAAGGDARSAAVAGWALVHGLATLWRDGNLPAELGDDPVAITERIGEYLFQSSRAARR